MYKKILVCIDNSVYSNYSIDIAVGIASHERCGVTGLHVYAAELHNERFRKMEPMLPEKYQHAEILKKEREIHSELITKGLEIISNSYMTPLKQKCIGAEIAPSLKKREGKNYEEILKESREGNYDLIVMGALGLGSVESTKIGSVCERVCRYAPADALIVRCPQREGNIVVAIDGSPRSFGALKRALSLSKIFSCEVEVIASFDPDYHYAAFKALEGVLTEEEGSIFKFKEQKELHTELIDKNLAGLYTDNLDRAVSFARREGFEIKSKLLSGKPFEQIIKYAEKTKPFMLALGKSGIHAQHHFGHKNFECCGDSVVQSGAGHAADSIVIGSTTENCLREAAVNVYISALEFNI